MKHWQNLIETDLPNDVDLSSIVKFCATTRSLFIETIASEEHHQANIRTYKNVQFSYEGKFEDAMVIVRDRKYFLPVNPEENVSVAGKSASHIKGKAGETTWKAVRIKQGQNGPIIDINDFTYANSLVLSYVNQ